MKIALFATCLLGLSLTACGDADSLGIGAACAQDSECSDGMTCLLDFKGGACGKVGCTANSDCPEPGVCASIDGEPEPLCLRSCTTKSDCNANRATESEANCTANLTLLEPGSAKACVPPVGS